MKDLSISFVTTALIQVVNRVLDHSPGSGLSCYSPAGAHAARRSDLGLWGYSTKNWRPTVSTVVNAYLTDPGKSNADAAHRLWLLRSAARKLTTGFAVNHSGGWTWVGVTAIVWAAGVAYGEADSTAPAGTPGVSP